MRDAIANETVIIKRILLQNLMIHPNLEFEIVNHKIFIGEFLGEYFSNLAKF
jgi:hypothetical protein